MLEIGKHGSVRGSLDTPYNKRKGCRAPTRLINSFDSAATTKITISNRRINKLDFEKNILLKHREDGLNTFRDEYNQMLTDKGLALS